MSLHKVLPTGLLAALLLLMATAGAVHGATLNCTNVTTYTVDTTNKIQVGLDFKSIGPVLPNAGVGYYSGGLVYGTVNSAQWDGTLNFTVTLDAYAPDQPWVITTYECVYNDSGKVDVRYYDVVEKAPNRTSIAVVLTVPPTYAQYNTSTYVPVSQPLYGYCSAPPTLDTWPNCPAFTPEPNYFVSASYPAWSALQVNGYKPGDVVSAYGVNATIPNPWTYGVYSDVGTLSSIQIDGNDYGPDAADIPVSSKILLTVEGMPTAWGSVKAEGASAPLYVVKAVEFTQIQIPPKLCKPPSCIALTWIDINPDINESTVNKTWCVIGVQEVPCPKYLALVAVESGDTLSEFAGFPIPIPGNGMTVAQYLSEIRLPLGSVYVAPIYVEWDSGVLPNSLGLGAVQPQIFLTDRFDAGSGTPYLRVLGNATYYEAVAGAGKVNGPLETVGVSQSWSVTRFAVAVDRSLPSISVNWYVWPVPAVGYPLGVTSLDAIVEDALTIRWPIPDGLGGTAWLTASAWPTDALLTNYPDISGGRYLDLLHLLYGDPTAYYWGSGDQYSAVAVHTASYYDYTTADAAGLIKLYHVEGIAPADVAALFVPSAPQVGGGNGSNNANNPSGVGPWLVSLVPTAACRSMLCTSLSPELLGPLPPFPGDRALPDLGYSIMLTYIGPPGAHDVKVYVGSGYVISSNPSLTFSSVRDYELAEIDMQWSPMQAVVVGPGWWVPYRPLAPCSSMPLNASSIYATPDSTGIVNIIVNDNGVNYTYGLYVLDNVSYLISTSTPAPAALTGTPFNVTAYVSLGGVPYFHYIYGFGEGGRLSAPACYLTQFGDRLVPQLALSGDLWGSFGLAEMPLRPVEIRYSYSRPRFELVDPLRGLVEVEADGPVEGFAFYAQRNGTWVKVGEARGSCVLVNVSRVFPWDPVLVLPLVGQELAATPGEAVTLWRPETALLFKAWADLVGYPKGARSQLVVVGPCSP